MNQTRRVLILAAISMVFAGAAFGGRREMIRVGPSDTWCPVGITGGGRGSVPRLELRSGTPEPGDLRAEFRRFAVGHDDIDL